MIIHTSKNNLQKCTSELFSLIRDNVIEELDLINQHCGLSKSPIFNCKVDYSQYLPRGHYQVMRYFKLTLKQVCGMGQ